MTEWVKTTDRLPPVGVSVLAFVPDAPEGLRVREMSLRKIAKLKTPAWTRYGRRSQVEVTHWRDMPEGPRTAESR
jgi:hypothetical protein